MTPPNILLVEDEPSTRSMLSAILKKEGYAVAPCASGEEAVSRFRQEIHDVVLTDYHLGHINGLEVLTQAQKLMPEAVTVILTGRGTIGSAVEAMKAGAFEYLTKPVNPQELVLVVRKALEHQKLKKEVGELRSQVREKFSFKNFVYVSSEMQKVLELVGKVAKTDSTVLIQGESGTGKELIAQSIHRHSPRRNNSFIAINCGALPENLLESELFGHVKGAFTGALANKKGLFEEASGGTLFLDEITEMSPLLQVKLLRALQENEIRRIGDNKTIDVDVRVLAATNRELKKYVEEGKFRNDLYFRVNVFPVILPPLRERKEDILPLAEHFLRKVGGKLGKRSINLDGEASQALMSYSWPGNVRELEHIIERACILQDDNTIETRHLPSEFCEGDPQEGALSKELTLREVEKKHIVKLLKKHKGDKRQVAKSLGITSTLLGKKIKDHRINGTAGK